MKLMIAGVQSELLIQADSLKKVIFIHVNLKIKLENIV